MLGRWKSLSTHRGWRGNRGRREIFDRNRPIGPQRAQYFYFNTSGINILAFVVWHLVSRVGKIFVHPSETDYDTEAERFGDNSFTGWAGEKDWQEEAAHPSSSRDIFVDLMDRPGEPLCHANIPRKYHARWPPFVSISSISWNLTLNASMDHERRFHDSLGTRDLSLDPFPRLEITLSENKLLNYLFGIICVDISRLFDKVWGCLRKKNLKKSDWYEK